MNRCLSENEIFYCFQVMFSIYYSQCNYRVKRVLSDYHSYFECVHSIAYTMVKETFLKSGKIQGTFGKFCRWNPACGC